MADLQKAFNFNKSLGQNFIFDKNLLRSIVKDAGVTNDSEVLEIGAGAGTLTEQLCEVAKKVVSYEIDRNLKEHLQSHLSQFSNLTLEFADALKEDLSLMEKHFDGEYLLVANLPYYITTPLIFKFVENSDRIISLTVMVQDEVARRLVSHAGKKEYGAISLSLDAVADVKYVRKVGRQNFTPVPNVDSAIVKIVMNKNKYDIADRATFLALVKASFAMRRKTLANNLTKSFAVNGSVVAGWLSELGVDPAIRGEALTTSEAVTLANIIYNYFNKTN